MKEYTLAQDKQVVKQDWRQIARALEHELGAPTGTLAIERRFNRETWQFELVVRVPDEKAVPYALTSFRGYPVVFEKAIRIQVGAGLL